MPYTDTMFSWGFTSTSSKLRKQHRARDGGGGGGEAHTTTHDHTQTWDHGTRYNKAHTCEEHSAENMTPSLRKHTRAPVHGSANPPTLNYYLMCNKATSQHMWQAHVH